MSYPQDRSNVTSLRSVNFGCAHGNREALNSQRYLVRVPFLLHTDRSVLEVLRPLRFDVVIMSRFTVLAKYHDQVSTPMSLTPWRPPTFLVALHSGLLNHTKIFVMILKITLTLQKGFHPLSTIPLAPFLPHSKCLPTTDHGAKMLMRQVCLDVRGRNRNEIIFWVVRLVFTAIFILILAKILPSEALVSIAKIPETLINVFFGFLTTSLQQAFVRFSSILEVFVAYNPLY